MTGLEIMVPAPEPPTQPVVIEDHRTGLWRNKFRVQPGGNGCRFRCALRHATRSDEGNGSSGQGIEVSSRVDGSTGAGSSDGAQMTAVSHVARPSK